MLPRTTGDAQNNKFSVKCSAKWQMKIIKRRAFNNNWWLHNLYQCGSIIRSTDKLTKTVFQYLNYHGIWQITAHIRSELYKKCMTLTKWLPLNESCFPNTTAVVCFPKLDRLPNLRHGFLSNFVQLCTSFLTLLCWFQTYTASKSRKEQSINVTVVTSAKIKKDLTFQTSTS